VRAGTRRDRARSHHARRSPERTRGASEVSGAAGSKLKNEARYCAALVKGTIPPASIVFRTTQPLRP